MPPDRAPRPTHVRLPVRPHGAPYGAAPGYGGYSGARTNSLAIISFIASLVGMFVIPFLASVAAVITGHMSLGQIKRTGEGGRGLALAGTIIGWVGVAFSVLGLLLLLSLWPLFVTSLSTSGI